MSVILFEPQIPENTGFTARSMQAFGFDRLVLVNPKYSLHPRSPAYRTSSGAQSILDTAHRFTCLQDAIADANQVIGFSRRKHRSPTQQYFLHEWLEEDKEYFGEWNISLLFGPEKNGLPGEAISLCTKVVEIPQHHPKLSLNLSHAVAIVLYEVYRVMLRRANLNKSVEKPAIIDQSQIKLILESIIQSNPDKDESNFGKQKRHEEILQNLLQRSHITKDEFSVLIKYIKK